jgi:putative transposase
VLVTALGIDGNGDKHPLGLVEGATENTAVVQALIDNLIAASSTASYAAQ